MISDHVIFSSPHFQVDAGEDEETNPGIFGKALANWIAEQLRSRGVTVAEVIAEDYGRAVIIHHKPFRLWIACASCEDKSNHWQMFIATEQSVLRKLFARHDPGPELEQLRTHYRAILASIPGVSDVEWQEG